MLNLGINQNIVIVGLKIKLFKFFFVLTSAFILLINFYKSILYFLEMFWKNH